MSTPSLLARRSASVCLGCRRQLLRQRQFSTRPLAAYQAYTLPSHPPVSPRNANDPDTSIAQPVPPPPLPRIHDTRPPEQPDAPPLDTSTAAAAPVSLPEREAQQSKPEFAATAAAAAAAAPPSSSASSSSLAQLAPTTTTTATTTTTTTPPSTTPSPSSSSTAQQAPAGGTRPRSRLLRTPRKAALRLTPAAVAHLRELLDQPGGEEGAAGRLVKVGVRNRGCSGLAYHLQLVDGAGALDETVEQDGVRVVIDSKALFSIIGSEMDWVEDKLSQRFVFRNPNIKEECGCGESFMV